MAQMTRRTDDRTGVPDRRERAQAIILAGFILAIGIVAAVAIMNTTIESINLAGGSSEDTSAGPVDYRETMQSEGTKALDIVNTLATQQRLHWRDVNGTYVNYTEDLNFRLQKVIESQAAVEVTDLEVNSSFNNSWRMRKNQSTSFQQVVRKPVEVVYAIDSSGSMDWNDPSGIRYDATKNMTANLSQTDRVALVDWDHDAGFDSGGIMMRFQNGSGTGRETLNQTVTDINSSTESQNGGTYIGGGLREALDLFREDGQSSHDNIVVLLSDGGNTEGWMHFPRKYAYSGATTNTLHEWAYNNDDSYDINTDDEEGNAPTGTSPGNWTLNDRSVYHATKPTNQSITVYTIGLDDDDGCLGVNENLMEDRIANATGGKYYCGNASGLNDIFNQIADEISEPTSLASNVSRFDRFQVTVDEFSVARNLTVKVRNSSNDELLWQMNASNSSGNTVVSVSDGDETIRAHDWTDPEIGGTPLEIDVLGDTINGADRNLSKNNFTDVDNISVIFDEGQGVNGTYDIWTDTSADVTGQCADDPSGVPCGSSNNQTVGAIHGANFTVTYESSDVTYTDEVEVTATDEQAGGNAPLGGGSTPTAPSSPSGPSDALHFDPPYHDFETYWPMDQNSSDDWPDQHAYDAAAHNHTGGLETHAGSTRPDIGVSDSMNRGSYEFSESDGFVDMDAWNDVPLEGPFTMTFWVKSDGSTSHNGTILDASDGSDRDFEMGLYDGGEARWLYDGNGGTVDVETDTTAVDNNWYQVALVGGWNQSVHGLFVREAAVGSDWNPADSQVATSDVAGKPMQEPIGSGSYGPLMLGKNTDSNGAGDDFLDHGFDGKIDDFRLYHDRLADATVDVTTHFADGFDANMNKPANWSTSNSAGENNVTWNDDYRSVYTCCESDSIVEMKNNVDVFTSTPPSSATLDVWVQAGDWSFSNPPNGVEGWFWPSPSDDLRIEYLDDSGGGGTWRTLKEFDGGAASPGQEFHYSTKLPADALHTDLKLRFRQTDGDGAGEDYWHIDNVRVTSSTVTGVNAGQLDQVYNDVQNTTSTGYDTDAQEGDRYFVTEYKTFDDDVDVGNLELKNVIADNGSGTLRVRAESNITGDATPENVTAWTTIRNDTTEYELDPEPAPEPTEPDANAVNMTVPNDDIRLRVEAEATDTTDSPRFHEADLVAP